MPNIPLTPSVNLSSDVKARPSLDALAAEMSSSQFMDMMMTRLTALSSTDNELKTLLGRVAQNNGNNKADNEALLNHLKKMSDKAPVERAEPVKRAEAKEKIKARIQEIAAQDKTPVEDTRAMKALQKVAKFLLKADEQGSIELPPEMVQKLQEFLAKGDDLRAFDMASFMAEFIDMFKGMVVNMNATASSGDVTWDQDIKDALNELDLGILTGGEGQPVDMIQIMRVVKTLVNQSEKSAVASLNAKADQVAVAAPVAVADTTDADMHVDATVNFAGQANVKSDAKKAAAPLHTADSLGDDVLPPTAMGFADKKTASKTQADSLLKTNQQAMSGFGTEDKPSAKDTKSGDLTRYVSSEAAAKASTQNNAALATNLKNSVATPVGTESASAQQAINKVDASMSATGHGSVAAKTALAHAEAMRETATRPSTATQQVMAQIQVRANKSAQISVQLSPAELGRVEVRLNIAKDGTAHAIVVADRPETLALLQKDASHLERALQQAGINANAGNMSFNLRDQQQAQQFGQGRKRFSRQDISDIKTQDVSAQLLAEASIISDTRINYHA